MLPPMIYHIINPNLKGLEPEGAYMMLCQKVLPAGLIGLVLAGMISATSSKANTTINLVATVFANDIYKTLIRPGATEKEMILIARIFTLLFGIATIVVAILIPRAGGIVEVVLSTASIAGGALFGPIIWSLFSTRQDGRSLLTTSLVSLGVNLFLKVGAPALFGIKFNRTYETLLGVGIPILIIAFYEISRRASGIHGAPYLLAQEVDAAENTVTKAAHHNAAEEQNRFGVRVIAVSMAVVGAGIFLLGILATAFSSIVMSVGGIIFLSSGWIWWLPRKKKQNYLIQNHVEA